MKEHVPDLFKDGLSGFPPDDWHHFIRGSKAGDKDEDAEA